MPTRTAAMHKLVFNEKLMQNGKGAGTDALLKRLKTLHGKLAALEQDATDKKSLNAVRKQLIDSVILHHKDRGVKALAACCLADLLRLYAPDAPFTADELRDIFQFFVVQITQNLKLPTGSARPLAPSKRGANSATSDSQQTTLNTRITEIPYYTEYCYLLDNLASIKSVVLICDLPGAEELVTTYFESFVEVVRTDMNKNLIRNLASILVEVLNESETVPTGVMDCILAQFTPESKADSPSFQLIVDVCNRSVNKLSRPLFTMYSDIQLEHGRDPSPEDLRTLTETNDQLLVIFRNAPNLLVNIIPLLEENLRAADETPLREISVKTLGSMFGERPLFGSGVVDIARAFPSAWRSWIGRHVDKALPVRLAWVEAAGPILVNHSELRKELEPVLQDRIQDADERVRAAVCRLIGSLDYETVLHHVSKSLLLAIGLRMSDKKAVVRTEAINALAKLWGMAESEIEANDADAVDHFAWIPQEMVRRIAVIGSTAEMKSQIIVAFKTHILPLPTKPDDEQAWVDDFLLVASHMDDPGLRGLDKLTGLIGYAKGMSPYGAFIPTCEQNNGGAVDGAEGQAAKDNLAYVIDAIVRLNFGDADKARKDLEAFAAANEPRMYKLFKALVDPQSDLRMIVKSKNELLRRIEQSHTAILETFTVVIDAAAWNVVNHSSIPGFIKRMQKPEGPLPEKINLVCARYLSLISKECAPMYKNHVPELVIVINDKKNDLLVEVALQALAAVCKWDKSVGPSDKRPIERAKKLALSGTPRQAKFASRFIASCNDSKAATDLVSSVWKALQDGDEEQLLPLLRSCQELALSAAVAFETKTAEIIGYIMSEVMLRRSPSEEDLDDRWVEEEELETLDRAKLIGLRVCTHRSLGWARDANALDLVAPTFNLLSQILTNDGQVSDETMEGGKARCHMRLRAALCMVKLARVRVFDKAISPHFVDIAFTMQDVNFTVRYRMLKKLHEVLPGQRLMPKWNLLPILVAQDPEADNINLARTIMSHVILAAHRLRPEDRIDRVEMPLARLLHLLTQHPDLDWKNAEDLKDMARFIELFVECIAQRENIALLYTIANKLKTVCVAGETMDEDKLRLLLEDSKQPAGEDDDDEAGEESAPQASSPTINLYKLSELSQIILRNCAQRNSWPLSPYPGKIKLPRDIFLNLPSAAIAHQVSGRTYLGESVAVWAKNFGKKSVAVPGSRRAAAETSGESRKRTRTAGAPRAPRKKRRASRTDDEDDEDDEDGEDSESDSGEDEDDDEVAANESDAAEGDEGGGGEAVMGRGGRRNAKTKAKKAVTRKAKKKKVKQPAEDSELSELSDE